MSFVGELVRATLHDGEVRLVTRQRSEAFGKLVVGSGLTDVGKPGLFGHPETDAEKNAAFGGGGGCGFAQPKRNGGSRWIPTRAAR